MYVHATHVFAQRPAAPQAGSPPQFSRIFKAFETESRMHFASGIAGGGHLETTDS